MTSQSPSFTACSDDQLVAEVSRLAANERGATAALIQGLIELDVRRLYLREGCSSLFTYCTQVLHLAEGAAYNRIECARAAQRFPMIVEAIVDGALTLTAVRLLAPHLTPTNHRDVLASARHKSKRDIEMIVATLQPKPPAAATIRKLATPPHADVGWPAVDDPARRSAIPPAVIGRSSPAPASVSTPCPTSASTASSPPSPASVTPLAPDQYRVQLTISAATYTKLRRVQDLLRHAVPDGSLAAMFDRAVTILLADLERRRCAAVPTPRSSGHGTPSSRHIPAAVRREVWKRDAGRCAFVGTTGRCHETGWLEFHHVEPYATGGAASVTNIELRCRAHNAYEASLAFGCEPPDLAREARASWPHASW